MSIITMPTTLYISSMQFRQARFEIPEESDITGSGATRQLGPPRWAMSIGCDNNADLAQAAKWRVMVMGLEGQTNRLYAYDPGNRQPRGTMRGTLTLGAALAKGSKTVVLAGAAGTLLEGDFIQVGTGLGTTMLFQVQSDVTASSGTATVTVIPASRYAFGSGTPVNWDHPRSYYRMPTKGPGWTYEPNSQLQGGFAIDLMEAFN